MLCAYDTNSDKCMTHRGFSYFTLQDHSDTRKEPQPRILSWVIVERKERHNILPAKIMYLQVNLHSLEHKIS